MKKMLEILCVLFTLLFAIIFSISNTNCSFFLLIMLVIIYYGKNQEKKFLLKKQRDNILQVLNHDLKITLLAQLRGLEFLQKKSPLLQKESEILNDLLNSTAYSLDMINLLSDLYTPEQKILKNKKEIYNLSETLLASCKKNINLADEKQIDFYYQADCNDFVYGNQLLTCRILEILISIAIFHSLNKKEIFLNACTNKDFVEFNIKYKGLPFIIDSSYETVGQGLKINVCKKLLANCDGKIAYLKLDNDIYLLTFKLPLVNKFALAEKPINTTI